MDLSVKADAVRIQAGTAYKVDVDLDNVSSTDVIDELVEQGFEHEMLRTIPDSTIREYAMENLGLKEDEE